MATGNVHKKFAKFCLAVFELCEQTARQANTTDRQTYRQTGILITIFCNPTGAK